MRRSLSAALVAALVAVVSASLATGSTARTSETKRVPGTAHVHNGVLLDTIFKKGQTYTMKISGTVDISPSASRMIDPVYCFKSAVGTPCQPTPYAVCGVQLSWYRGTTYSHFTGFGCPSGKAPLQYEESHVYEDTIVPPFDARLKVGVSGYDTDARDNTGSFTVTVTGPPTTAKPRTCTRTYVVQPGGARIAAQVHNVDLTSKQVADVLAREKTKYEGWAYTPIGRPTRKVNCAGFVMLKLFGGQMVDANVNPDTFFRAIVKPFGSKRFGRVTARAGDVVVWRSGGVVQHVAFVESGGVRPTILTKDGTERLYRAKLALAPRGDEPLTQAHGSVEFWKIDRSKVKISVVAGKDCGN